MPRINRTCAAVELRDPLEHFAVLDDDNCGCSICAAWRKARQTAGQAAKNQSSEAARRVRYQLQAFNARRDVWIESSYHASLHKYGKPYMAWLATDTADIRRRYGWWANEASRLPMSYWFERFESAVRAGVTAVTGAVSGAFSFKAHYIEIEEEGGGYASLSTLDVDGIVFDGEPDTALDYGKSPASGTAYMIAKEALQHKAGIGVSAVVLNT